MTKSTMVMSTREIEEQFEQLTKKGNKESGKIIKNEDNEIINVSRRSYHQLLMMGKGYMCMFFVMVSLAGFVYFKI